MKALFALCLAPLALGCGEGAPGDLDKVPPGQSDILGSGQRLHQINDRAGAHPPDGTLVQVTGVSVLALDTYDETGDGARDRKSVV